MLRAFGRRISRALAPRVVPSPLGYRLVVHRETEWHFDAARLAEALRVRDAVARLVTQAFPYVERGPAWTVLTELITNVVRHAPGMAEVRLVATDGRPTIHVLDRGPGSVRKGGLPLNPLSEGGRGLFIVNELAYSFELLSRPDGGTHAIAVLK
jgi:anti-sigma regulatory factor (Ser/Thr protein kinase)